MNKRFGEVSEWISAFILLMVMSVVLLVSAKVLAMSTEEPAPVEVLPTVSDDYYLPAEVLSDADGVTYFDTPQGVYAVLDEGFDPDTEYLLSMASAGTPGDVTDDEVCVIWQVHDFS